MANEVAVQVTGWIESAKPRIRELLPQHVNQQRFFRNLTNQVMSNPELQRCDKLSIIESCVKAANLGLEIGVLSSAYLIRYKSKCELVIGYQGLIDLAMRSGGCKSVNVLEVKQGDEVVVDETGRPKLRIDPFAPGRDDLPMVGAICSVELTGGGWQFTTMTKEQYEKTRPHYWDKGHSPHKTHPEEMWKKAAIRRAMKTVRLTPEFSETVADQDRIEHPEFIDVPMPQKEAGGSDSVLEKLAMKEAAASVSLDGDTVVSVPPDVDPDTGEVIPPESTAPRPKFNRPLHLERAQLVCRKHKLAMWKQVNPTREKLLRLRMKDLGISNAEEFWDFVDVSLGHMKPAYLEGWKDKATLDVLLRVPQRGNTDHLLTIAEGGAEVGATGVPGESSELARMLEGE